jgi:hypothetical protein
MTEKVYKGRTEDAAAPFLSAEFWKKGTMIAGTVERLFKAGDQQCCALRLINPVTVAGEETDQVSLGAMAGLRMAIQAAHLRGLAEGDKVWIECTGQTAPKKVGNSPRVDFSVEVVRDDEMEQVEVPF